MPFLQYSLYNIIGGVAWVVFFLFLGFFFGNISFVKNNFSIVVLAIIVISLIPAVYTAIKSRSSKHKT